MKNQNTMNNQNSKDEGGRQSAVNAVVRQTSMKKPRITEGEWNNEQGQIYRWGNGPETKGYRPNIAAVSIWKDAPDEGNANAQAISAVPYPDDKPRNTINKLNAIDEALRKAGCEFA